MHTSTAPAAGWCGGPWRRPAAVGGCRAFLREAEASTLPYARKDCRRRPAADPIGSDCRAVRLQVAECLGDEPRCLSRPMREVTRSSSLNRRRYRAKTTVAGVGVETISTDVKPASVNQER